MAACGAAAERKTEVGSRIFIGNLDFNTSREEIETLFGEAGQVRDVFLPTDRETGRPRGFAFVEFESDDEASSAIERFNGHELSGRALRVNAAEDRPRRFGGDSPPFGGGGGFGAGRGGGGGFNRSRPKGSRRNIRAKKRGF